MKCLIISLLLFSPVHSVLQLGRTVIVTSTGLDSFPPQSVATTDRTWLLDSTEESSWVLVMTPDWLILKGWSGLVMEYWQMSPNVGEQSLSVAVSLRMKSARTPSSTWPLYSSSVHSGMYSLTSFTVTSTSTLKYHNRQPLSSLSEALHGSVQWKITAKVVSIQRKSY